MWTIIGWVVFGIVGAIACVVICAIMIDAASSEVMSGRETED